MLLARQPAGAGADFGGELHAQGAQVVGALHGVLQEGRSLLHFLGRGLHEQLIVDLQQQARPESRGLQTAVQADHGPAHEVGGGALDDGVHSLP